MAAVPMATDKEWQGKGGVSAMECCWAVKKTRGQMRCLDRVAQDV